MSLTNYTSFGEASFVQPFQSPVSLYDRQSQPMCSRWDVSLYYDLENDYDEVFSRDYGEGRSIPRIEDVSQNELNRVKRIEYYDEIAKQWQPIGVDSARMIIDKGLTSSQLKRLMDKGLSPVRAIGLTALFPDLTGKALFNRLYTMFEKGIPEGYDEYLESGNNCFVPDPDRPNSLVLVTSHDNNGAFQSDSIPKKYFFSQLAKTYNFCRERITSLYDFCGGIDRFADEKPINLLIIHAHGQQKSFSLSKDYGFTLGVDVLDEFPSDSCLKRLAPNATIILDSCTTGKGKEFEMNLANHIANHAPPGVRLFAPTVPVVFTDILEHLPIDVRMRALLRSEDERYTKDVTYVIDPKNKEKHCPPDRISYLQMCNTGPLLRFGQAEVRNYYEKIPGIEFYQRRSEKWQLVPEKTLQFLADHRFCNRDLERIADLDLSLEQFEQRMKKFEGECPKDFIDQVAQEVEQENRRFNPICSEVPVFRNKEGKRPIQTINDIGIAHSFEFYLKPSDQWIEIHPTTLKKLLEKGLKAEDFSALSQANIPFSRALEVDHEKLLEEVYSLQEKHNYLPLLDLPVRNKDGQKAIKQVEDIAIPFRIELCHPDTNEWFAVSNDAQEFLSKIPDADYSLSDLLRGEENPARFIHLASLLENAESMSVQEIRNGVSQLLEDGEYWLGHYFSYQEYPHGHFDCAHGSTVFDYRRYMDLEESRRNAYRSWGECSRGEGYLYRRVGEVLYSCLATGLEVLLESSG
ncbi:hypothetical protein [Simkania sp.]|uniref:hypothetical protein n=1 Tax=Simkania sp. TaxID=34094 RepID=UPI003B5245F7